MFLVDWFYGVLALLGLWQKEAKILFLGLDNASKTAILHTLKGERLVQDEPTEYPTSEELSIGKIKFKIFDLGGHQMARRVLMDYYAKVDAVVYVVDLCFDSVHFFDAIVELDFLLREDSLATVPFLILCNNNEEYTWEEENFLVDYINFNHITRCLPPIKYTGKGYVNLPPNVRPLEVFMCKPGSNYLSDDSRPCPGNPMAGPGEGFKWMSQYIK